MKSAQRLVNSDTRLRILDSAENLFAQRGFSGTSVKMIATKAKVTGAMIHYYFDSKEKLYHAVIDRIVLQMREQTERIFNLDQPPAERLEKYLTWFINYTDENPNITRLSVMGLGGKDNKYMADAVVKHMRPFIDTVVKFIDDNFHSKVSDLIEGRDLITLVYSSAFSLFGNRDFIRLLFSPDSDKPMDWDVLERTKHLLIDAVFIGLGIPRPSEVAAK